jgi:hypothetical protein
MPTSYFEGLYPALCVSKTTILIIQNYYAAPVNPWQNIRRDSEQTHPESIAAAKSI